MLEGFAQSGSNAYNMPAKELQPPFSGEEKDVQKGARPVYPGGMACMAWRACETLRGQENAPIF